MVIDSSLILYEEEKLHYVNKSVTIVRVYAVNPYSCLIYSHLPYRVFILFISVFLSNLMNFSEKPEVDSSIRLLMIVNNSDRDDN